MPWHASLQLDYHHDAGRTRVVHRHEGPLRVFRSLYPEGEAICHNVIVHPPGGIVSGDRLDIRVMAHPGSHALISTPGATRFYESNGLPGAQHVHLQLQRDARLEWVPLECIAYPGCLASNQVSFELAEGAQLLAWDVVALGLPAAGKAFDQGSIEQRIHWPGVWLEQARIRAEDRRLLDSPVGLGGRRAMGSLWLACGTPMADARREALAEFVRQALAADAIPAGTDIAVTSPDARLLVVRGLADAVEPLMTALQCAWKALRVQAWELPAPLPRIWQV